MILIAREGSGGGVAKPKKGWIFKSNGKLLVHWKIHVIRLDLISSVACK